MHIKVIMKSGEVHDIYANSDMSDDEVIALAIDAGWTREEILRIER